MRGLAVRVAALVIGMLSGCECSPPSCRSESLSCEAGETPVCQERACGRTGELDAACDPDPCASASPRVCAVGLACDRTSATCRPAPDLLQACDPGGGAAGCSWPWVCKRFEGPGADECPERPQQFPPESEGVCAVGRQTGDACDASWDDTRPSCRRCEPGLECMEGVCVHTCNEHLDCPCEQQCFGGVCAEECVVGLGCERLDGQCGECLDTIDGPRCVPVGGRRDGTLCVLDESPPQCRPESCGPGEVAICGGSRCAQVAEAWDSMLGDASCTVSPCETTGTPRVCPFPTTCLADSLDCPTGDCPGHCITRSTTASGELSACSARSENNNYGTQCTFPLVCRGFAGDETGAVGGCPARGAIPSGYLSVCVRGQQRGDSCDADYRDNVTSCQRCEPGLTCIDGRCQQPCDADTGCPCGELCNAGVCGPACATLGTACTATVGLCGTCMANPLGPPVCDPGNVVTEGCGATAGSDDDCDGMIDELTPDRRCDGIDDDCDGATDEDWTFVAEFLPNVTATCPGGGTMTMPGHWECQPGGNLVKVATPGVDYCDAPGAFPSPTGSGFLYCGGGLGDACGALPCHWSFDCVGGTCQPSGVSAGCTLLCNPSTTTNCVPCDRRGLGTECVWPGTPP